MATWRLQDPEFAPQQVHSSPTDAGAACAEQLDVHAAAPDQVADAGAGYRARPSRQSCFETTPFRFVTVEAEDTARLGLHPRPPGGPAAVLPGVENF